MKKLVFRFDIDSHKCIRDGVPNLLKLAKKYNVAFTFFLNTGRAVSIPQSIKQLFNRSPSQEVATHLSALRKLGWKDFTQTVLCNPKLGSYREQIRDIIESGCELGLHGGRNHATWHLNAHSWNHREVQEEIQFGLAQIKAIQPEHKVESFASPGWTTSPIVSEVVRDLGIKNLCDTHADSASLQEIITENGLRRVPTNILSEPGGVAFFENCIARGLTEQQILNLFFEKLDSRTKLAVVYDHPYFAGVECLHLFDRAVQRALEKGYDIVPIRDLR